MNWKRQILIFLAIFAVVGLLTRGGGCPGASQGGRPADAEVVELSVAGAPAEDLSRSEYSYTLRAEVADTAEKRRKGLSGRGALEPGYGMIYVYEEPKRPEFAWGEDYPEVSAAFLGEDGTIARIYTPSDRPDRLTPEEPVKFLLEVRQGWFEDRGVKAGDRLEIPNDVSAKPEPQPEPAGPDTADE